MLRYVKRRAFQATMIGQNEKCIDDQGRFSCFVWNLFHESLDNLI